MVRCLVTLLTMLVTLGVPPVPEVDAVWYGGPEGSFLEEGFGPSGFFNNGNPADYYIYYHDTVTPTTPGDHVYLSSAAFGPRRLVLAPTNWLPADDAQHTAAPSVIQNPPPTYYPWTYLMYYECAKKIWRSDAPTSQVEMYTEICVAASNDKVTWRKYNYVTNSFHSGAPTAIITWSAPWSSSQRKTECGEQLNPQGRWLWNYQLPQCKSPFHDNFIENYGVGHPSALVVGNQIQIFYYDSNPGSSEEIIWRAISWDGVHFDAPTKVATNLAGAVTVRYYAAASPMYIATYGREGFNYFKYSTDGITFCGANDCEKYGDGNYMPLWGDEDEVDVIYDGALIADQWGRFYSWTVPFLSSQVPAGTTNGYIKRINGQFYW